MLRSAVPEPLRSLLGTLVEIIPSFPGTQPLCSWSVPGPSYPLIRVLLISFPSLTGTKPACLFGGFRSRSTSYSSFSFYLASVLLPCSLCQLYVVIVLLISFPRITGSQSGTKPAYLTGGFRSRATICSTSFLWKLVYECCTLGIHQWSPIIVFTYVFSRFGSHQAYLPLRFVCWCCVMESKCLFARLFVVFVAL